MNGMAKIAESVCNIIDRIAWAFFWNSVPVINLLFQRIRNIQTGLNTKTLNENLLMWKLKHPDMEVTLENLRNAGDFPMPMLKPNQEYFIHENAIRIRNKNQR